MRAYALIDQNAFLNNLQIIKNQIGDAKIMAMVKGNCYGHGLDLLNNIKKSDLRLINYFGVATVQEGKDLLKSNLDPKIKIVVMGGFCDEQEFEDIYNNNFAFVLHNWDQIKFLENKFKNNKNTKLIDIWFKIDTGMHRLGFNLSEATSAFNYIKKLNIISDIKIMTHFACADIKPSDHMLFQIQSFNKIYNKLLENNNTKLLKSAANSKALLNYPESIFDIVRPGLMLYGIYPDLINNLKTNNLKYNKLSPVMELRAKIIAIKSIKKGAGVGYGQRWIADKDTTIAVISIGYADGYYANAPDNTPVLIKGCIVPLIGRVSMDSIVVDISLLDEKSISLKIGDEAVLWGKGLPVSKVAKFMGYSVYSLLTGLTNRVKRIIYADVSISNESQII
jgi:alanine racemase